MKKILFPFEINKPIYENAFIYAVKLARNFRSELIMLNPFSIKADDSITRSELDNIIRDQWLEAYKEVFRLKTHYLRNHARIDNQINIRFDYRVILGNFVRETSAILEKEEIDLLILPVPEKGESGKNLSGLVQREAFEENNTSVILVPPDLPFLPVKKIALATDLSRLVHFDLYCHQLINFARILDSEIHFIHLDRAGRRPLHEGEESFSALMKVCKSNTNKYFIQSLEGRNLTERFRQYLKDKDIRLLAVVRHHPVIPEWFFSSKLEDNLSEIKGMPVMILKEHN